VDVPITAEAQIIARMADPKAVCFMFPSLVIIAKLLYEKTLASPFVCGTLPPRFQMSR
jgi:hypothetical protein